MHRRLLALLVVLLLRHGTFSTAAGAGGGSGGSGSGSSPCNRRCGDSGVVPYPFGFSAGCLIALSCDASTSGPALVVPSSGGGQEQEGNTTRYRVVSFNATASTMVVSFPAVCAGRSVGEARRALSGANYGVSSRTGLFLQGGCHGNGSNGDTSSSASGGICSVPEYVMSGLLRTARCPGVNGTASLTCIGNNPPAPGTTTGSSEHFLHWEKAVSSNCDEALTSTMLADTPEGTPSLELGVAELGWWANGTCDGANQCVPNAACSNVQTPDGGQGHRCACKAGMAGDGCYRDRPGNGHVKKTRKIYIIASTSSTLVLCLLFFSIFLGYKIHRSRKKSKETPGIESFLQKNRNIHPKRYTYAQVKRMTKTFAEKLGQGGFGVVYRGGLSDGRQVAVKMLKDSKTDVEEFINEVSSISRTSHVNVVTLLGFCLEGSKRALIYDYMPNGSLEKYAFKGTPKVKIL